MDCLILLDCSSRAACIGVSLKDELQSFEQQGNEELVELFNRAIDRCGCSASDISGVVLAAGPGSFTGLRASFAFSYGLMLSRGIPWLRIESMAVIGYAGWKKLELRSENDFALSCIHAAGKGFFVSEAQHMQASQLVESQKRIPISLLSSVDQTIENISGFADASEKYLFGRSVPEWSNFHAVHLTAQDCMRSLYELSQAVGAESWQAASAIELAESVPLYIQPVKALTIAERKNLAESKKPA